MAVEAVTGIVEAVEAVVSAADVVAEAEAKDSLSERQDHNAEYIIKTAQHEMELGGSVVKIENTDLIAAYRRRELYTTLGLALFAVGAVLSSPRVLAQDAATTGTICSAETVGTGEVT